MGSSDLTALRVPDLVSLTVVEQEICKARHASVWIARFNQLGTLNCQSLSVTGALWTSCCMWPRTNFCSNEVRAPFWALKAQWEICLSRRFYYFWPYHCLPNHFDLPLVLIVLTPWAFTACQQISTLQLSRQIWCCLWLCSSWNFDWS